MLSLELILQVLKKAGPVFKNFKNGDTFIYAIRKILCVALLENCTSHNTQIAEVSLQIFVTLMEGYKDHLKSEIEVFLTTIFIKTLESENSTYEHKMHVLKVFHSICKDSRALVELFINYDCDLDAIDIYRRTLDAFAKMANNPTSPKSTVAGDFMSGGKESRERGEHSLRMMGLEGLVLILQVSLISLSNKSNSYKLYLHPYTHNSFSF